MKCPKCGYVSHDYLDACRKCSADLVAFKRELHLEVIQPGDLDLSEAIYESGEALGSGDSFGVEDDFFDTQVLVEPEETAEGTEEEFDIVLDDEPPSAPTGEVAATTQNDAEVVERPGRETPGVASLPGDIEADDVVLELDAAEEVASADTVSSFVESAQERSPSPPVEMIDMSDLEDLDDDHPDKFEEPVIDLDLPDRDHEAPPELDLPPAPEGEIPLEPEAATPATEEMTLAAPEAPLPDETVELTPSEARDEPYVEATPEIVPELVSDDHTEAELVLELEKAEDESSSSEDQVADGETETLIDLEDLDLNENDEKT
jgi:hypothetical protein